MIRKIARTYPFRVVRYRLYLPLLRIIDRLKDFLLGIKTEDFIELDELGIDASLGGRYEPTSYKTLNRVLKIAKKKGFDSMIDIGCGNGRSLVVANEVGFTNLYGVDISSNLIANCEQNLKK